LVEEIAAKDFIPTTAKGKEVEVGKPAHHTPTRQKAISDHLPQNHLHNPSAPTHPSTTYHHHYHHPSLCLH
jgi:hypothetical protein